MDRFKECLELCSGIKMCLVPFLLRQYQVLTGISRQQTGFYCFVKGLMQDILVKPQRTRREPSLAVHSSVILLFIDIGLQYRQGDLLELDAQRIEIGQNVAICQGLIL